MTDDGAGVERTAPTMTVPELAQRVGVDQSTAWRYLRAGKLPGLQVGNRWVIDRERVERFLAGHEDAAGQPLIDAPPEAAGTELTLLPARPLDTAEVALTWLRGAHAALELLLGAAEDEAGGERGERRVAGV